MPECGTATLTANTLTVTAPMPVCGSLFQGDEMGVGVLHAPWEGSAHFLR